MPRAKPAYFQLAAAGSTSDLFGPTFVICAAQLADWQSAAEEAISAGADRRRDQPGGHILLPDLISMLGIVR
jgi:hypothetical protein